jgi:hypothetical protein
MAMSVDVVGDLSYALRLLKCKSRCVEVGSEGHMSGKTATHLGEG